MKYVEAPQDYSLEPRPWVFLAGGITDCPDWQQEIRKLLADDAIPGTMLNPRRANFPIHDPDAAREQITWEYHALNKSDVFSMWFSAGPSPQPICMYELGRHLARFEDSYCEGSRHDVLEVCIGVEPGYIREQDVRIQTSLVVEGSLHISRTITRTLEDHAARIKEAVARVARRYPSA